MFRFCRYLATRHTPNSKKSNRLVPSEMGSLLSVVVTAALAATMPRARNHVALVPMPCGSVLHSKRAALQKRKHVNGRIFCNGPACITSSSHDELSLDEQLLEEVTLVEGGAKGSGNGAVQLACKTSSSFSSPTWSDGLFAIVACGALVSASTMSNEVPATSALYAFEPSPVGTSIPFKRH